MMEPWDKDLSTVLCRLRARMPEEEELVKVTGEELAGYPWWRRLLAFVWPIYEPYNVWLELLGKPSKAVEGGGTWAEPRYSGLGAGDLRFEIYPENPVLGEEDDQLSKKYTSSEVNP